MKVCFARTMPSTTGFTASRWLGFGDSDTLISRPDDVRCTPLAPRWYFTSPEPCAMSGSTTPSNSPNTCAIDFPIRLASTVSRPRCAMPITISCTPASAARSRHSSSTTIALSPPSSENRFCPTNRVCRKFSNPSACSSRSRIRRRVVSSSGQLFACGSIRSCSHRFSSGCWMCMYSHPSRPQ